MNAMADDLNLAAELDHVVDNLSIPAGTAPQAFEFFRAGDSAGPVA
jgi:hypothetical protein